MSLTQREARTLNDCRIPSPGLVAFTIHFGCYSTCVWRYPFNAGSTYAIANFGSLPKATKYDTHIPYIMTNYPQQNASPTRPSRISSLRHTIQSLPARHPPISTPWESRFIRRRRNHSLFTTFQPHNRRRTSTGIHTHIGNVALSKQTKGFRNEIHTHTHLSMEQWEYTTTSHHAERWTDPIHQPPQGTWSDLRQRNDNRTTHTKHQHKIKNRSECPPSTYKYISWSLEGKQDAGIQTVHQADIFTRIPLLGTEHNKHQHRPPTIHTKFRTAYNNRLYQFHSNPLLNHETRVLPLWQHMHMRGTYIYT